MKLPIKIILNICFALFATIATVHAADEQAFDEGVPEAQKERQGRPFGNSLFAGNFAAQRSVPLDPNYVIMPGDRISLHIWGAIQSDETTVVDSQGNLFIPEVGAVKVSGITAAELPIAVKTKLRSVYKEGVDVYVNLLSGTPVNVFVTGPVTRPGQYAGTQADSVLSFLHRAGGILANQGSYRNIRVMRRGKAIASVDLYSFLRWGQLPRVRFQNGDTILVSPQSSTISVSGDARGSYIFEFKQRTSTGSDLMKIARPNASVTDVALSGSRNRQPWSTYQSITQFSRTRLMDGDVVRFITDSPSTTIDISIEGSHLGNSYFATKRGTRLQELLDYVAISPDEADIQNIYIKRKSVAERQRTSLEESIRRLERSVLTAPVRSNEDIATRQKEAALVSELSKTIRATKQDGRVIVSENGNVTNIRLEDGDIIVIPYRSDVITISGEVNLPQSVVYASNATINDYVMKAGGFSERANTQQIIIRKPNGQTTLSGHISAGDEIIIFPKVDSKNFQFAKDIMGIIFQIAATSKAVGIL